jgi:hypothetical protein
VEEVVDLTLGFYKRNYIEGLFLSSGIIRSADYTMEEMVRVAKQLPAAEDHDFRGYIHLKVIPEASPALVNGGRPVSPTGYRSISSCLETTAWPALAPEKRRGRHQEGHGRRAPRRIDAGKDKTSQSQAAEVRAGSGQSTQMIVGADAAPPTARSSSAAPMLYGAYGLRRVYYSAFSPIPDTTSRLPPSRPPLMREHRLYQADWLMRFYGFERQEIAADNENLDLAIDPKLSWALRNRGDFPVDVNRADRERLLRIPGLGVKSGRSSIIAGPPLQAPGAGGRAPPDPRGIEEAAAVSDHRRTGGQARLTDRRRPCVSPCRPNRCNWTSSDAASAKLASETDFAGWRDFGASHAAWRARSRRTCLWTVDGNGGLFDAEALPIPGEPTATSSPSRASSWSWPKGVMQHRSGERFALLYRLLWRLGGEPNLMHIASDPDVAKANDFSPARASAAPAHKMKAFVRFPPGGGADEDEAYRGLVRTGPSGDRGHRSRSFVRRFTNMRWSIAHAGRFAPIGTRHQLGLHARGRSRRRPYARTRSRNTGAPTTPRPSIPPG